MHIDSWSKSYFSFFNGEFCLICTTKITCSLVIFLTMKQAKLCFPYNDIICEG